MLDHVTQAKTYLTNLTKGTHTLTLYASDTAGNMVASQTITFTVDILEPFRTAIIIAVVLTGVVVLAAVSLLAHKRHGRIANLIPNTLRLWRRQKSLAILG